MAEVHGSCDDRFSGVREALERQLDGDELGASIAVDLDGETVVDLWGGYRDQERTTPWTQDTIENGCSQAETPEVCDIRCRTSTFFFPFAENSGQ